jgi:succinate dehydrogenase / fumarate reductase, cytochrome b subunit
MSTAAIRPVVRTVRFYEAPIGKKVVMAVTGLVLFAYVVGHLLGNLQIYVGPHGADSQINHYAAFLHSPANAGALWVIRAFLTLCVVLHIFASAQLWLQNRAARPVPYFKKDDVPTAYAARTMIWSGPIIAAFVIFHVLHLTAGGVVPLRDVAGNAATPDVRANVIYGFHDQPAIAAAYIFAMVLLCLHLFHGVWSMFQSVGANNPSYTPRLKKAAGIIALLIAIGNISIPVAAVAGWLTD